MKKLVQSTTFFLLFAFFFLLLLLFRLIKSHYIVVIILYLRYYVHGPFIMVRWSVTTLYGAIWAHTIHINTLNVKCTPNITYWRYYAKIIHSTDLTLRNTIYITYLLYRVIGIHHGIILYGMHSDDVLYYRLSFCCNTKPPADPLARASVYVFLRAKNRYLIITTLSKIFINFTNLTILVNTPLCSGCLTSVVAESFYSKTYNKTPKPW